MWSHVTYLRGNPHRAKEMLSRNAIHGRLRSEGLGCNRARSRRLRRNDGSSLPKSKR
jgi:hypothetical protein